MELSKISVPIMAFIKKYRYVLLVLLLGIVLMCLPRAEDKPIGTTPTNSSDANDLGLALRIEDILKEVNGTGKVKVLLAETAGEQYIYQTDIDDQVGADRSTIRKDTVIITDANRNEQPILTQVIPPRYCGAVIICQGGDDPTVRLAVVEAVSKLTGLGADKICVLKMK